MKKSKLMYLWMATSILFACNDGDDKDNGDTPGDGKIEAAPSGNLVSQQMGTEGDWYAVVEDNWVQLSQTAGKKVETVYVNTTINHTDKKRETLVNIYAGSLESGLRAGGSPIQSFTIKQEGNPNTATLKAHFTAVKMEDGILKFKLWTGAGGTILDLDNSYTRYYSSGGINIADGWTASKAYTETDWVNFYRVNLPSEMKQGKIEVGGQATINSIEIRQEHTLSYLGESTFTGTGAIHFCLGDKIYYGGGFTGAEWRNSMGNVSFSSSPNYGFYALDPSTGKSKQLKDLPFSDGRATIYKGEAYALDGSCRLYKYNASGDSWTSIQVLNPGQKILAFYAVGDDLFLTGASSRYVYRPNSEKLFELQNTTSHGAQFYTERTGTINYVQATNGEAWLLSGGVVYRHTASGYDKVGDTSGYLLGVHQDEAYIYSSLEDVKLQKMDAKGKTYNLDLFFDLNDGGRVSDPCKYAVNREGVLYILGGSRSHFYNPNYYGYSADNRICKFDLTNCSPAGILLVTDK
ncbi:hypothetical protein LJB91_02220 [Bacteroidales bacterium OttesenSCG-928-L03]|nr:hypothetical protein [Bacteroidales bacterium OttesenSCG-928-L03]